VVDNDTFYNVTTASVGNKVACSVVQQNINFVTFSVLTSLVCWTKWKAIDRLS